MARFKLNKSGLTSDDYITTTNLLHYQTAYNTPPPQVLCIILLLCYVLFKILIYTYMILLKTIFHICYVLLHIFNVLFNF